MRVRLRVLVPGTRVRIRHPGLGERGTWLVDGRVIGSGRDDPAHHLHHTRSGRTRMLRRCRLRLVRSTTATRRR
jgi:hypothetical protein